MNTKQQLEGALERRKSLEKSLNPEGIASASLAYRIIHGDADGFDMLTADLYGPALLVEQHFEHVTPDQLILAIVEVFGEQQPLFLKKRYSKDMKDLSGEQICGRKISPDLVVEEQGLRFAVNLAQGEHTGLFLDSRPARSVVRRESADRRVLNLFSYTGAFGVAAEKGGARSTTNIDNKRTVLKIAAKNYQINDISHNSRTFLESDTIRYLNRARRSTGRYDLVIVDPPPRFKLPKGRRFDARRGYAQLIARCLSVIDSDGLLLAGLNARAIDDETFEQFLFEGAKIAERSLRIKESVGAGSDFPPSKGRPAARFALCEVD